MVTLSPDVSVSTNLGGWINKFGVFHPEQQPDYLGSDRLLRWQQGPQGRHIELGLSEMNLFLALHALGLGHELHGEHLIPIGTVYDPFVCRGLDALIYGLYSGARFILVGTPAGVTLAPEGGAHQSTITPSIALELPGITFAEPCYAQPLDWLLCDGIQRLSSPDGESLYLRLSTRPTDQAPFALARERLGEATIRQHVLAGGYRLIEPDPALRDAPQVIIASCGAVLPEAVHGARMLTDEGVAATVLDLTSPDRLYREWRSQLRTAGRQARPARLVETHLATLITDYERDIPIITVHDAASHALAWLGSVFGQRVGPSASTPTDSLAPSSTSTTCSTYCPSRSPTPRSSTWGASATRQPGSGAIPVAEAQIMSKVDLADAGRWRPMRRAVAGVEAVADGLR